MTIQSPLDNQFPRVVQKAFPKQMDFWDGFKPVYYFSRAFGLLPFSICRTANGDMLEPKVNRFDGVWFLFTTVVFLSAPYFAHRYIFAFGANMRIYISILLDDLHFVLSLMFGALSITMDMCNRFEFAKLWAFFINFDREVSICSWYVQTLWITIHIHRSQVSKIGIEFCYKSDYKRGWLCCTMATLAVLLLAILTYVFLLQSEHSIRLTFVFMVIIQNCILVLMPVSFITLLFGLRQRYATLTSHLRYLSYQSYHILMGIFQMSSMIFSAV